MRPKLGQLRKYLWYRGVGFLTERPNPMVAANKYLLREVRRLAIKDELLAMRLRGRLVVPLVAIQPAKKKPTGTG